MTKNSATKNKPNNEIASCAAVLSAYFRFAVRVCCSVCIRHFRRERVALEESHTIFILFPEYCVVTRGKRKSISAPRDTFSLIRVSIKTKRRKLQRKNLNNAR